MTGAGVPWWTPRVRGTLTTLLPFPDDTVYRDELEPCTLEVVDTHAGAANGVANGLDYDSGRVEYDVASALIIYEEYHPFGTSAYRAVDSTIEVSPKRYRYAAAERDEETGLDHMGLRYYAPWLGRWTSADPIGLGDGVNLYAYVHGNPVSMRDPGGTRTEPFQVGETITREQVQEWSSDTSVGAEGAFPVVLPGGEKYFVLSESSVEKLPGVSSGLEGHTAWQFKEGSTAQYSLQQAEALEANRIAFEKSTELAAGRILEATAPVVAVAEAEMRILFPGSTSAVNFGDALVSGDAEDRAQAVLGATQSILGRKFPFMAMGRLGPGKEPKALPQGKQQALPQGKQQALPQGKQQALPAAKGGAARLPQDIAVNPDAPRALPLSRSVGRASHNSALQADIAALPKGATGIRVNQQQVNALGQRVGVNRPDLQYTLNGKRYYVEYEGPANPRGAAHEARILANDPNANFLLRICPMTFPSRVGGATTQEVGFFCFNHRGLAEWIIEGLGPGWIVREPHWQSMEDALQALQPVPILSRYACLALEDWTVVLNNGPMGTDVGVLPSHAARELECRAIRAVRVDDDEPGYPARVLEVFGPGGKPPLALERSVTAANDGGRWVFEANGTAFDFEDEAAYRRRIKSSRFTGEMLHDYLAALDVPVDSQPDWRTALLIERP